MCEAPAQDQTAAPFPTAPNSPSIPQMPENYFYVPDLGQVPEIDVPSYLPDLPGVADDLMYSADLGPGIAPSAPGTIPELPTFHTEVAEPFKPGELRAGNGLGWEPPAWPLSCQGSSHLLTLCPRPRRWGADGTPTPTTASAPPSPGSAGQCSPTPAPAHGSSRTDRQGR